MEFVSLEYSNHVVAAFTVFVCFVVFSALHIYLSSKVEEVQAKKMAKFREEEYMRGFDAGREQTIEVYEAGERLRSDLETEAVKKIKSFKKKLEKL